MEATQSDNQMAGTERLWEHEEKDSLVWLGELFVLISIYYVWQKKQVLVLYFWL